MSNPTAAIVRNPQTGADHQLFEPVSIDIYEREADEIYDYLFEGFEHLMPTNVRPSGLAEDLKQLAYDCADLEFAAWAREDSSEATAEAMRELIVNRLQDLRAAA